MGALRNIFHCGILNLISKRYTDTLVSMETLWKKLSSNVAIANKGE